MNSSTAVENIYLLVIVTLISVLQNAFFAQKVERECKNENNHTSSLSESLVPTATAWMLTLLSWQSCGALGFVSVKVMI
ncbi:Arachidonate 5-lipoxygenase-activating protein [Oryzias melastigma]|uniref:Arachidonate 5-lipoxygenase-activating protein n=1 Tax=Oryzias melastigma TaxID=30732 RepID=A0A834BYL2_ORYME|nr:Arachidonate 5-lipoxygenase-activating protein [Oryzias melastigma]